MDTLLQQAQSIATAAKKLSLEIKATETTKATTTPFTKIMLEIAVLAIENTNGFLYLNVDISHNLIMSSVDVFSWNCKGRVDGAACRVTATAEYPTALDDLLAYKDKVLANIELAKQQQRLAEEQYA